MIDPDLRRRAPTVGSNRRRTRRRRRRTIRGEHVRTEVRSAQSSGDGSVPTPLRGMNVRNPAFVRLLSADDGVRVGHQDGIRGCPRGVYHLHELHRPERGPPQQYHPRPQPARGAAQDEGLESHPFRRGSRDEVEEEGRVDGHGEDVFGDGISREPLDVREIRHCGGWRRGKGREGQRVRTRIDSSIGWALWALWDAPMCGSEGFRCSRKAKTQT